MTILSYTKSIFKHYEMAHLFFV